MVTNAGLGVVIGESVLSNKNLGKTAVSSNNENGVAEAIEKYVI